MRGYIILFYYIFVKMAKKLFGLMLALSMVTVMAGCTNSDTTDTDVTNTGEVVVKDTAVEVKEEVKTEESKEEVIVEEDTTTTWEVVVEEVAE